ncbi:glutamine ABC transporter ATP-binding protein [compost metagenome]
MDEPTAALDPARRESLATVLRELTEDRSRSILIATPDLDFAALVATHRIALSNGIIG